MDLSSKSICPTGSIRTALEHSIVQPIQSQEERRCQSQSSFRQELMAASLNAATTSINPSVSHQVNNSEFGSHGEIHKKSASSRHRQTVDAWTDNLADRLRALTDHNDGMPLFVPITVTFKAMSIRDDEVLGEFSRFYARLARLLVRNSDRPSKREFLPFAVAWRDDPSTRPDKYHSRPTTFSNHPSMAPHVHALTIIHPSVAQSFLEIAGSLESIWQRMSIGSSPDHSGMKRTRNRTLHADIALAQEIRTLMRDGSAADLDVVHSKIRACVAYSSKLERRSAPNQSDVFAVLPNFTRTEP